MQRDTILQKIFLGHKIHMPSGKPPSSVKKDWRELKMLNEINKKDMAKVEYMMRDWTLYETGWYISSIDAFYDSLFIWLTQQMNRPHALDIVYQKK